MRCANAGPTRGSRVMVVTSARSRSIRSPGASGRARAAARCAVSRKLGVGLDSSNRTSPGAGAAGAKTYRTPAPTSAKAARSRAARRSSTAHDAMRPTTTAGQNHAKGAEPRARRKPLGPRDRLGGEPPPHRAATAPGPSRPLPPRRARRRTPCRWCPEGCASRGSRSPRRRSLAGRLVAAPGGRRSACGAPSG